SGCWCRSATRQAASLRFWGRMTSAPNRAQCTARSCCAMRRRSTSWPARSCLSARQAERWNAPLPPAREAPPVSLGPLLDNLPIGRQRQELGEALGVDELAEELGRILVAVAFGGALSQLLELLVERRVGERARHLPAVLELGAVADPLPDLTAADLGGGGVLHEVVKRHAADAAQPGFDVAEPDIDVGAQSRLGDRAARHFQQIGGGDVHVLALAGYLVHRGHALVEDFLGNGDQARMRHPGAVMAFVHLALLVGAHLG